jgi:beta-glucosidase
MGAALTRGLQRHVMACVKHFALNSMENGRFTVDVDIDDRTLHEVYLPHFKRVVDEGVASVMSAYNSVNGQWCGHHNELLRNILKRDWDWDGFVITDFVFGMRNAQAAIEGGQDIEMPFRNLYARDLPALIANGTVDESLLREAATRITRQLLIQHDRGDEQRYAPAVLASDGHRALAHEAARKSMVLLKNERDLLPLTGAEAVALIGRFADVVNTGDHGSSRVFPPDVVTPAEGLRNRLGNQLIVDDGTNAATVAAQADVAIVIVGYSNLDEGEYLDPATTSTLRHLFPEPDTDTSPMQRLPPKAVVPNHGAEDRTFSFGGDRSSLQLVPQDLALIDTVLAANPNTIVAMICGSAVVMESWRHRVPAIITTWYSGMEGGNALADLLLGDTNPSGRLPFTIATDELHYPFFDKDATNITYEYLHGYRKLAAEGIAAAYPFGYGLSYTTFEHSDMAATRTDDGITVTCAVTNAGGRSGDDVVQVYASFPDSVVSRPPVMLAGFERITVDAGQSVAVTIHIPMERLATYDPATRTWQAPGVIELSLGHHVEDRPLTLTV